MKFCPKCGSQLPDDAVICSVCGETLAAAPAAPAAPAQPATPAQPAPAEAPFVGQPAQPQANPYAAPQPQANPYAAPQPQANPYAAPQQPTNPYAAPQQPGNPYGAPQQPMFNGVPQQPVEESANIGLAVLSFIIPILGLVFFLTKKDTQPKTAKACGIAALISVGISILMSIVSAVMGNVMVMI